MWQVVSGDTLIVVLEDRVPAFMGTQQRVNLASIRAPRLGSVKKNVEDEIGAAEARDALIELAIGKRVSLVREYERVVQTGVEEVKYEYFTVVLSEGKRAVNLGEELVKR